MAVSVNHRYSDNFSLLTNFTWAHAMDYNPYMSTGYGTSASQLDPLNPSLDYATSSLNVRHRFVAAATYRTNFRSLTSWRKDALNGWGFAPILQMQNGLPYSPGTSAVPWQRHRLAVRDGCILGVAGGYVSAYPRTRP